MRRPRLPEHDDALLALGRAVLELRARRRMSQEALAHRAGTHRNYAGMIERGEANLGFLNLLRILNALGVPLAEFSEVWDRQLRARQDERANGADPRTRPIRCATRLISSRADRPHATTIPPWPAIRSTASAETSAESAPNAASPKSR